MFVRTFFINEQIIYGAYVIATCMSRCHMTISNNLRIVFDKKNYNTFSIFGRLEVHTPLVVFPTPWQYIYGVFGCGVAS